MKTINFILVLIVILLCSVLPAQANEQEQEAVISDLVVVNNETDLLAFFQIDNAFSNDLKNGVQHGIPVTFTYEIVLVMNRNNWIDKEIFSGSFNHTMTYDNLKKEYTVTIEKDSGNKIITTDFTKAMEIMSEVNSVYICPLEKLLPDNLYTLKVKATLAKTTLPLNFHYLIPFTEFWDLQTDWTEVQFRY